MGIGCHALRRSFASFCVQADVELLYCKSLLNHGHGSDITLNAYVQLAPVKRLEAMQRVSDFIETRLMGLSPGASESLAIVGVSVGAIWLRRAMGGVACPISHTKILVCVPCI